MKSKLPPWLKLVLAFVVLICFGPSLFFGYLGWGGYITGAQFLTGWASFLSRNAQKIEFDPLSVATFLLTLGGFAAGVHFAGRLLRREAWRPRWTFGIVAGSVLLFAAGMTGVGLLHHGAWYATSKEPLYTGESWDGNADYQTFFLQSEAESQKWSTARLREEVHKIVARYDGRMVIFVAEDAAGEWRAIVGWDRNEPRTVESMVLATRSRKDYDAIRALKDVSAVFEYCTASRVPTQ